MSPLFWRRRRASAPGDAAPGDPAPGDPAPGAPPPDPAGALSAERLDRALARLRQEIPAPSAQEPQEPSA